MMSHRWNLAAVTLAAALLLGPAVALAQQPQVESQVRGRERRSAPLPRRRAGRAGVAAAWLRAIQPHVAAADAGAREESPVIAADLRGAGQSNAAEGYTKSSMARDVQALMKGLGHDKVSIVGHDMGSMVAYAYAVQFPGEVKSIALLDGFLPGVGEWTSTWLARDQWHFVFQADAAGARARARKGLSRALLERLCCGSDQVDPEADRRLRGGVARPNHVHAGMESFVRSSRTGGNSASTPRSP